MSTGNTEAPSHRTPRDLMQSGTTDANEWSYNLRKAAAAAGGLDHLDLFVWFDRAMQARNYWAANNPPASASSGPSPTTAPSKPEPWRLPDGPGSANEGKTAGAQTPREKIMQSLSSLSAKLESAAKISFVQAYLIAKREGGVGVAESDVEYAARLYDRTLSVAPPQSGPVPSKG